MSIGKGGNYIGQHCNSPHRDGAQRHGTDGTRDAAQHHGHTGVGRADDGQHYSTTYTNPSPQMYSHPGGVSKAGYVGHMSGGEMNMSVPAVPHDADFTTTYHVPGQGGATPKEE